MNQLKQETDQEIMARLRRPIDELIEKHCGDKTEMERLRLRQLAWQAVDVLVRTRNIANLENQPDIKRITQNIKEVGASEKFIQESLFLALTIYKKMQADHPGLLKRYGG
ncbi:MAG: hypothetical protein JW991_00765 [Candidatus Pacebacteria bacterium]|nr:hypothetical protein [Candidatus Paceibacterota bacterium]